MHRDLPVQCGLQLPDDLARELLVVDLNDHLGIVRLGSLWRDGEPETRPAANEAGDRGQILFLFIVRSVLSSTGDNSTFLRPTKRVATSRRLRTPGGDHQQRAFVRRFWTAEMNRQFTSSLVQISRR